MKFAIALLFASALYGHLPEIPKPAEPSGILSVGTGGTQAGDLSMQVQYTKSGQFGGSRNFVWADGRLSKAAWYPMSRTWKYSVAAMLASTTVDIITQKALEHRGGYESNPLLATNGKLGARGIAISVSAPVAVALFQYWILRRHRRRYDAAFSGFNYGYSGVKAGLAIHNGRQ